MDLLEKLTILADGAKYDASCTSSGSSRQAGKDGIGSAFSAGICHTWSSDGRCISLLKVLFTNYCEYDCVYCVNRKSNDVKRAAFTPRELADLTLDFYKRNYIEGLFISSGVIKSPDYTMQLIINCMQILRNEYKFYGYIHAKIIPGTSEELVEQVGFLADRVSVNIELPSEKSLLALAPQKTKMNILSPMKNIKEKNIQTSKELTVYKNAQKFAPAGQSTQMIVGASDESDFQILRLTQGLYDKYKLKRVFYSAYIAVNNDKMLPALDVKPPLLREHRLYQADWLLRFYNFRAEELLSEENSMFNPELDPKCNWAVNNLHLFPVEINTADYETLLRVPGIGVVSAKRIIKARKVANLDFEGLKRIGVVLKRAKFFITCKGKAMQTSLIASNKTSNFLALDFRKENFNIENNVKQLSLFDVQRSIVNA